MPFSGPHGRRAPSLVVVLAAVVAFVLPLCAATDPAAAAVSGLESTTSSLVIDPSGSASTDSLNVSTTPTLAYVQRMPVTKVIDRVTLGDFRSSCGGSATLYVREHNPESGAQDQITYSPSAVAWPASSGKVTWVIPATRLVAGRGYAFLVSGSGCVQQTSWGHDSTKVNGGWRRCTDVARHDEQSTINESGMDRMWHVKGQTDNQPNCASFVPEWYADIPTGWVVTFGASVFGGSFEGQPSPQICDRWGNGYNSSSGAQVVKVRDREDLPGYAIYACVWPQYGPLNESVANGWHYGLPWRASGVKGVPREAYVKLHATASGPSASEFHGIGAAGAAPNLSRPMCADPVSCTTGNFTEVFADLAVGGRGVGLALTRTYNSQAAAAGETGPFGYGWSSSFGERLTVASSGDVTVRHDDGSTASFTPSGEGNYAAAGWVQSELAKRGDGSYAYMLPDQRVLSFTSAGRLEWVEDRNENRTTLTYSSDRLTAVTDPSGRSMTFDHNPDGTVAEATDPVGHSVSYAYSGGELSAVTDAGEGTTAFDYDGSHRMTSVTDPRDKETTNAYDSQGRVVEQTDPMDNTMTWDWSTPGETRVTDATGRVTIHRFSHNLLTSVTKGVGTAEEATWTYEIDEDGNTTSVTDPNTHEWVTGYDERGNHTSMTDPLTRTTSLTYDGDRNVTSTTIPGGRETRFGHDSDGNLTSIEQTRTETSQTITTTLGYDTHGQLTSSTDPLNRTTTYDYNTRGDRISTTTPEGKTTTATYDDASRVATLTSARGSESGADPAAFTTHTTRDAFGNPTDIEDPLGHHTLLDYDADQNLISATDRDGNETTYGYDDVGRPTTVTRADTSTLQTGYDAAGRMTSQTDGLNHTTTYAYDGQGRARSITDPLNRETFQAYDNAGNLTTLTDPQSRTTTYSYDVADRLAGVSSSTGSPGNVTITYTAAGERNTVANDTGTTDYAYDSLGRLTSHTNGAGQTTGYAYDLAGQLSSLDYPDALTLRDTSTSDPSQPVATGTVDRDYDQDGNLVSVTDWLSHETTFDYDAEGHLTGVERPNGTTATNAYDRNGALTELTDRGQATGLGRTPDSLLSSSAPPVGSSKGFAYDDVRRLTGAGAATYTYDNADNLTRTVGYGGVAVTQEFDAANQLTETSENSQPTATFEYDALGNRIERDAVGAGLDSAYGYDQAAQLVSYTGPNHAAAGTLSESYSYDADGLRQTKTGDGIERTFAYDVSGGLPLVITDGPTAYITGPGGLPIEQITQDGTVRYFHHDQLGSTTALSNQSGSTVATYEFDAYGNPVGVPPSLENPFGFAGQYTDAGTGLQYLRARYYDPAAGQFLTRDPQETDTRQPYAYADNSPANYTDPTGENIWDDSKRLASDTQNMLAEPAAELLHGASGGYSTKLAGKVFGFDADCADFGSGGFALAGSFLPTGRLRLLSKGGSISKGARAAKPVTSVANRASQLRARAGRNRVSIETPNGRLSVDLAGRSHYEKTVGRRILPPHAKFEARHVGSNGKISYTSGPVREATHADLRLVDRILTERGL